VQTLDYYPYGSLRVNKQEANFNERKKFTGYEFDDSTGLNYAGARYQSPGEGRFTSQDPVSRDNPAQFAVDPQQLNSYSYARNNPIVHTDHTGKCLDLCIAETSPVWIPYVVIGGVAVTTYLSQAMDYEAAKRALNSVPKHLPKFKFRQPNLPKLDNSGDPPSGKPISPWWYLIPGAGLIEQIVDYFDKREDIKELEEQINSQGNYNQNNPPIWQPSGSGTYGQQGSTFSVSPSRAPSGNTYSSGGGTISVPGSNIPRSQNPTGHSSSGQPIYCWGACGN